MESKDKSVNANSFSLCEFEKTATRVSLVSIIGNTLLSFFKLLAGILANSGAMISDAVHSASDVFSSIVVIIGVRLSTKESDKKHPYGHERLECVAAIILAVILLVCGIFIGHTAVKNISRDVVSPEIPGVLALVAALVSIVSKEAMYWYTRYYAKWYDSGALMADAWHHRSDALSSVGALAGIIGARLGFRYADSVASIVICLFIVKAAYDIFKDAVEKLIDRSCCDETEREIINCAICCDGVLGVKSILTRVFGNKIYVDIEIFAQSDLPLTESYRIATEVHDSIERRFEKIKHIMVCTVPIETQK